jgi:hypothetical protein
VNQNLCESNPECTWANVAFLGISFRRAGILMHVRKDMQRVCANVGVIQSRGGAGFPAETFGP